MIFNIFCAFTMMTVLYQRSLTCNLLLNLRNPFNPVITLNKQLKPATNSLLYINYPSRWSVDVCSLCVILPPSCPPILWLSFDVTYKKKSFPYGYGEHNVCSSTTPVFNFLTWKAFPSKETEKQSFFILTGGARSSPCTVCQPLFPSPQHHFALPPPPF